MGGERTATDRQYPDRSPPQRGLGGDMSFLRGVRRQWASYGLVAGGSLGYTLQVRSTQQLGMHCGNEPHAFF